MCVAATTSEYGLKLNGSKIDLLLVVVDGNYYNWGSVFMACFLDNVGVKGGSVVSLRSLCFGMLTVFRSLLESKMS